MNHQEQVEDFHRAFDIPVLPHPTLVESRIGLRLALIAEECLEWEDAADTGNLADMAKELADLLYVIYGTFAEFGLDSEAIFAEVHRSNMSKLGPGGTATYRADGKVLKPDTYSPADLGWINRKANMPRA